MKKALILILAVCMTASFAYADTSSDIYWHYKPYAETFGAPMFEKDGVSPYNTDKNTYAATAGGIKMIFELTQTGAIRTVLVCAEDDTSAADFLCSCTAVITWLGETDFNAFGNLVAGYGMIRSGSVCAPTSVGIDSFDIISSENLKYVFLYANNDLKAN